MKKIFDAQDLLNQINQQPVYTRALVYTLLGWIPFILYSIYYCQFYTAYIEQASPSILWSIQWVGTEYGPWPFFTFFLLMAYTRAWQNSKLACMAIGLSGAVAALTYRVGLDVAVNGMDIFRSSLVYFLPRHLTVTIVVFLGWILTMRPKTMLKTSQASATESRESTNKTLRVQSGTQDIDLPVTSIDFISAAGNYMEVCSGTDLYILRATMKELENELGPYGFVRIHRSYLVPSAAIVKIDNKNKVLLRNGKDISITARYRRNFLNNQTLA